MRFVNNKKVSELNIDKLNLSVRTRRSLKKRNIETIFELLLNSETDLLNIKGFGQKALKETKKSLEGLGCVLLPMSLINFSKNELKTLGDLIDQFMETDRPKVRRGGGDASGGG